MKIKKLESRPEDISVVYVEAIMMNNGEIIRKGMTLEYTGKKPEGVYIEVQDEEEEYEPYFGWCNVEGCENEGANGGSCWRETGYWTVCSKHSSEYRAGKPQPQMKQWAIDREKRRGADGVLVNEG